MLIFGNKPRCVGASWIAVPGVVVMGLLAVVSVSGCGGGGKPAAQTTSKEPATAKTTSKGKESSSSADDDSPAKSTATAGNVRKSSRGIPYDAFFDDPLGEANNSAVIPTVAATTKPANEGTDSGSKPAAEPAKPAAGSGGTSWGNLISMDVIQAETKKVRNDLAAAMKGPGDYNKKCKEIGWDASLLAGLAGITIEHSDAASWKGNAHYVRDFSTDLSNSATGPGKEAYDKSKVAFEKLSAVFDGSIPADAGDVPAKKPFHESADRTGVMQRIQRASEWLRLNINTEAKLKSDVETIQHEAMIVTALGKIIATEGYDSADEAEYQKFASDLIAGGQEAGAAAKDQNFKQFTDAVNKISKSCTDCHPKYAQ